MPEPQELPPDLALFLLCHAAVSARDQEVTRQGLRAAATDLQEAEAHKVALTLHNAISGGGRLWLSRLV
jgi:hypothetical protein